VSWLQKLLPPKIKRNPGAVKKAVPEGLWIKCDVCEAVLYRADLEKSLDVCPKCSHHNRVTARERLDMMLDPEGRYEIGSEVMPVDFLKFVDSRRYTERLDADANESGESDALVVMQGAIKTLPVVAAAFEFRFMGGSMGSVVGERFVRGVQSAIDQKMPFICFTASGGARMQEGLMSLMQMAKTTAALTQLSTDRLPFLSVLTDPTMSDVSASFSAIAMTRKLPEVCPAVYRPVSLISPPAALNVTSTATLSPLSVRPKATNWRLAHRSALASTRWSHPAPSPCSIGSRSSGWAATATGCGSSAPAPGNSSTTTPTGS